jgi:transglutaminase-like putative cysteine protease
MSTLGVCLLFWLTNTSALAPAAPAAVDREMVSWAAARVPAHLPAERRLVLLHKALVDPGGLALEESERTGTAREAFAERRANCVAFAHLYLGLARRLGLPVYFVLARGIEKEGRRRDLRVLEGHMAVGFGPPSHPLVVDAGGFYGEAAEQFERIADPVAEAIFFSNRGVEALLEGAGQNAVFWLERATAKAPELAPLWQNLGVARRRAGDLQGAALAAAQARRLAGGAPARLHSQF